jgi:hypothetical protein
MNCRVERRLHYGHQFRAEAGRQNFSHHRLLKRACRLAAQCDGRVSGGRRRGSQGRVFDTGGMVGLAITTEIGPFRARCLMALSRSGGVAVTDKRR